MRTIFITPKTCHTCGTPTTDYQALTEKDLHESVLDTLHRGDSRFIVDHRQFYNSQAPWSTPKDNERVWTSSSPMDWRDDMESYRLHMSRQSPYKDDLETSDQAFVHKRSESGSSVFMTQPGANIDKINERLDVRCAWDDGSQQEEGTKKFGDKEGDWGKEDENQSYLADYDNESFSDFEMIEDYDPKSGFTVRLRRRPFGETQKTSYVIHGIQDEEETTGNLKSVGSTSDQRTKENVHRNQAAKIPRENNNIKISSEKKRNRQYSRERNKKKAQSEKEKYHENKTVELSKSARHLLARTESFFTVGLDRRDYVFSEEPVLVETDEDDVILDPQTVLTDHLLSDGELRTDSWSSNQLVSGAAGRPPKPTPDDEVH